MRQFLVMGFQVSQFLVMEVVAYVEGEPIILYLNYAYTITIYIMEFGAYGGHIILYLDF